MLYLIVNLVEAQVHRLLSIGDGYIVILTDKKSEKFLTITIGKAEGEAIMIAKENIKTPRPLTHELTTNIIKHLDGKIKHVEIYDLRDGVYYAKIYISKRLFLFDRIEVIDARPSDAIALALRFNTKILINEKLFENFEIPRIKMEEEKKRFFDI